jgi:hypothetical protein
VTLLIRLFCPQDQLHARQLILAGLADHWGALDPTRNPDLDDIARSYAGGLFLVGLLKGRQVATGAYLPVDAHVGGAPAAGARPGAADAL